MTDTILEMDKITKLFPGVKALDNVSISVRRGEIHALVGENGAGKSTLMNVLSGVFPHGTYTGQINFEDKECTFKEINDSEKIGIAIIHQELTLIPYLTVAENVYLRNERTKNGFIDWEKTHSDAKDLLARVGLKENTHAIVKNLSVGKQQLVEIAKSLSKPVKLLILDEPTSALNDEESDNLLKLLLELRAEGITAILISHKLNEIVRVADSITIMRDGAIIETLDKNSSQISEDRIIKGMVGRALTDRFPRRTPKIGEIAFEVRNWSVDDPLIADKQVITDVSFNVRQGEIVGFAGLMGAGRTELAMSLFGRSFGTNISGQVLKNGREITVNTVRRAIANGISYATEDRKSAGLNLIADIKQNISIAGLKKISPRQFIDNDEEIRVAEEYRGKLKIKSSSILQKAGTLSGGNQQKVVLSKWLFTDPDLLILDEPTRGIDVGAKYEIYSIMNGLVDERKSIIFVSSELPELLGMCDRIYVMNEGKIVGELSGPQISQEAIMKCIMGSSRAAT